MARVELIMPKMGESIIEATILNWLKAVGDHVDLDESVLEIATDKVDSEVPSQVEGTLVEILYQVDDVVDVGKAIAVIETASEASPAPENNIVVETTPAPKVETKVVETLEAPLKTVPAVPAQTSNKSRFYSPLVMNIARTEQIGMDELESITGSGKNDRVTKKDILAYIKNRPANGAVTASSNGSGSGSVAKQQPVVLQGGSTVVTMDRMRKMISDHMVMSKKTSPHVTSFVEADVTNLVNWRNKIKSSFQKREGQKITFTPIFIEAVAQAIRDFPGVNASVDGYNIIMKKDINIGIAAALPSGNLIVPVVKGADQLNLMGITKEANRLIQAARNNKLKPEEIQGGTFTLTNVGTFGNLSGTPIINQPQVAILATGSIIKKPWVIETEYGDVIAIRQMMMMSLSYDHRVVDGFLGGSFLRKVADILEAFDPEREI